MVGQLWQTEETNGEDKGALRIERGRNGNQVREEARLGELTQMGRIQSNVDLAISHLLHILRLNQLVLCEGHSFRYYY